MSLKFRKVKLAKDDKIYYYKSLSVSLYEDEIDLVEEAFDRWLKQNRRKKRKKGDLKNFFMFLINMYLNKGDGDVDDQNCKK